MPVASVKGLRAFLISCPSAPPLMPSIVTLPPSFLPPAAARASLRAAAARVVDCSVPLEADPVEVLFAQAAVASRQEVMRRAGRARARVLLMRCSRAEGEEGCPGCRFGRR